jgi:hypothetical protein
MRGDLMLRLFLISLAVLGSFSAHARAVVYNVNRLFADENGTANLTGTIANAWSGYFDVVKQPVALPLVFGTAIPEPSAVALVTLVLISTFGSRRRSK